MKQDNTYKIQFTGLKIGLHQFNYTIEKTFFEPYPYNDFIDTKVNVQIDFNKQNTLFELYFSMQGVVRVNCDVSGEEYDQEVANTLNLIVKFGEAYNNEDEQILIIPHHEFELDVSQFIYELIVLSVPTKRLHPGIINGTLKSKAMDKLEEMNTKNKEQIDPRWEKLKGLIKDKKQ
ncbi:MAG: DUF177 domain-containing protein [Flavobacteriaceae bacterium]